MDADEVITHLCVGWQGFAGILSHWTDAGVRFSEPALARLREGQKYLADVLARQDALRREAPGEAVGSGP